jgi:prevent-host-death family protein
MPATRVTSDEFRQDFGSLSDKAKREPVIITQRGEDALVVVSVEEWTRLSEQDRKVGVAQELPDEWFAAVLKAEVPAEYAYLNAELD